MNGNSQITYNRFDVPSDAKSSVNANARSKNLETAQSKAKKEAGAAASDSRGYRLTSLALSFLCVLLLVAATLLFFLYIAERNRQQTTYSRLIVESDKLKQLMRDVEAGWRWYFRSSTYYISTGRLSWTEARQDCRQRGAELVVVNDREEHKFIALVKNGPVWIGLTDGETEGDWMWVDGTPLSTGYWKHNEPSGDSAEEDCVVAGSGTKSWADYPCSDKFAWICEKQMFT